MLFAAALAVGIILIVSSSYIFYKYEWKGLLFLLPLILLPIINRESAVDFANLMNPIFTGVIGGITFKKKKSLQFYLLTASVFSALVTALTFYYYLYAQNIDIFAISKSGILESLTKNSAPADIKAEIEAGIDGWMKTFRVLIPFISFFYSVILAGIGWGFIRLFFTKVIKTGEAVGLESFRVNDLFIYVLIAGFATVILSDPAVNELVYYTGMNLLLAAVLVYVIQGFAVIKFLLLKRGLPWQILPLSAGGLLLVGAGAALFSYIIISGLGALDLWADFRSIDKNNISNNRGEQ